MQTARMDESPSPATPAALPAGLTLVVLRGEHEPGAVSRLGRSLLRAMGDRPLAVFPHGEGRDSMPSLFGDRACRLALTSAALGRLASEEAPSGMLVVSAESYDAGRLLRSLRSLLAAEHAAGIPVVVMVACDGPVPADLAAAAVQSVTVDPGGGPAEPADGREPEVSTSA